MQTQKLTITVSVETAARLKYRAARRGVTVGSIVSAAVERVANEVREEVVEAALERGQKSAAEVVSAETGEHEVKAAGGGGELGEGEGAHREVVERGGIGLGAGDGIARAAAAEAVRSVDVVSHLPTVRERERGPIDIPKPAWQVKKEREEAMRRGANPLRQDFPDEDFSQERKGRRG